MYESFHDTVSTPGSTHEILLVAGCSWLNPESLSLLFFFKNIRISSSSSHDANVFFFPSDSEDKLFTKPQRKYFTQHTQCVTSLVSWFKVHVFLSLISSWLLRSLGLYFIFSLYRSSSFVLVTFHSGLCWCLEFQASTLNFCPAVFLWCFIFVWEPCF